MSDGNFNGKITTIKRLFLQFTMHLSLERILFLSALRQALGNSPGVSNVKASTIRFSVYTAHAYIHTYTHAYVTTCVYTHIHGWKKTTRKDRHSFTCLWTTAWGCLIGPVMCVLEYLRLGVLPPLHHSASSAAPKLQEAEEKGFASSVEMPAMLWQVLLMWDLSGWEIRGQFLCLWFTDCLANLIQECKI